jgi:hypothetical protein
MNHCNKQLVLLEHTPDSDVIISRWHVSYQMNDGFPQTVEFFSALPDWVDEEALVWDFFDHNYLNIELETLQASKVDSRCLDYNVDTLQFLFEHPLYEVFLCPEADALIEKIRGA